MMNLAQHEWRRFCQNGEDGIIRHLLSVIDHDGRSRCVELGSHYQYGNCYLLAEEGRPVRFVDMREEIETVLAHRFPEAECVRSKIVIENVNQFVSNDTLFLSLDIDGNDYWIWKAITDRPPLVVVEFNWFWPPPLRLSVPYDPDFVWNDGSIYQGASLAAFESLGIEKGYLFVGVDSVQLNAFFVRRDCGDPSWACRAGDVWSVPNWSHGIVQRPWVEV